MQELSNRDKNRPASRRSIADFHDETKAAVRVRPLTAHVCVYVRRANAIPDALAWQDCVGHTRSKPLDPNESVYRRCVPRSTRAATTTHPDSARSAPAYQISVGSRSRNVRTIDPWCSLLFISSRSFTFVCVRSTPIYRLFALRRPHIYIGARLLGRGLTTSSASSASASSSSRLLVSCSSLLVRLQRCSRFDISRDFLESSLFSLLLIPRFRSRRRRHFSTHRSCSS